MDKYERLAEFMEWVGAQDVDPARAPDLRRVALELLERSGGGRVTESHILEIVDAYAAQPGGDTALAEDVGDLFLRFEEYLRSKGRAAPAPKGRLGTNLPRRPRPPPAGAGSASSPSASSGSTAPPPAARATAPPPAVPSLTTLPPPARASAAPAVAETPVTFSSRTSPPPAAPSATSSTPSAQSFRCPGCKVMVTATADGACPRCGTRPPQLMAIASTAEEPSAAARPTSGSRGLLVALVAAAAAVGSGLGGWKLTQMACDSIRSENAAGQFASRHLEIEVTFPSGWRRIKEGDDTRDLEGLTMRSSQFYRGGTQKAPTVGMILAVVEGAALPADGDQISGEQFSTMLTQGAQGFVRGAGVEAQLDPGDCEIVTIGTRRTGRCVGSARVEGPRRVLVYVWFVEKRIALAVFLSKQELETAIEEADDIVSTVESLGGAGDGEPDAQPDEGEGEADPEAEPSPEGAPAEAPPQ